MSDDSIYARRYANNYLIIVETGFTRKLNKPKQYYYCTVHSVHIHRGEQLYRSLGSHSSRRTIVQ